MNKLNFYHFLPGEVIALDSVKEGTASSVTDQPFFMVLDKVQYFRPLIGGNGLIRMENVDVVITKTAYEKFVTNISPAFPIH